MKKLLLLLITLITFDAFADVAVFNYTPPDMRADNITPLLPSEIGGYNVYANGVLHEISPLLPTAVGFTLPLPQCVAGGCEDYRVEVTTLDTDARESVFSEPVIIKLIAMPNPPTDMGVTLIIRIE